MVKTSGFHDIDGDKFYTICGTEDLSEFFMSLVSSGNHWLFISSKGALTAGRGNPEHALFPYETVDKVMASQGQTGTRTIIGLQGKTEHVTWEPFAEWSRSVWRIERRVSKNFTGSSVLFEEENLDLGLAFSWSWTFSHRYGFVRHSRLLNVGSVTRTVAVVDGFLNLMSGGITRRLQSTLSCLTDAYKDACYDPSSKLAAFSLASQITDKAEPREALTATVAWHAGFDGARLSLCRDSIAEWLSGKTSEFPERVTGRKGDFLLHGELVLEPKAMKEWYIVADVACDNGAVEKLQSDLKIQGSGIMKTLRTEGLLVRNELERLIATADGLSVSALPMHEWHHATNTLFNLMRGGIPEYGMSVRCKDVVAFMTDRNKVAGAEARGILGDTQQLSHDALVKALGGDGNPTRIRLAREYLPLTFSRRHGDPSRPWNDFSIRVRDVEGEPVLDYQGNWRDIFQNWEALGCSYPGYLESFLAIFLNATTIDGYNPYRITRAGIDWERVEPDNPWSNIGYWSDHQIIYFQKLAESLEAGKPGRLQELMESRTFSWANVPYVIADYKEVCRNPRATIRFDALLDRDIEARVQRMGSDGRLVYDRTGTVQHSNLMEKLVSLFGTKIGSLVPGGGIWMNTQRPEWNDANNALAGYGLSVVTTMYLRRFTGFWLKLLEMGGFKRLELAAPLATLVRDQLIVLSAHQQQTAGAFDSATRKSFMDGMGKALDSYRSAIHAGNFFDTKEWVEVKTLTNWLKSSLAIIDATVMSARRQDGLYDSYNLLSFGADMKTAEVTHLPIMLEGQVAALSSGFLNPKAGLDLAIALRGSALYTEDRKSYLLYPDRVLHNFFTKNTCPAEALSDSALAKALVQKGVSSILYVDCNGAWRFGERMQNSAELGLALDELMGDPALTELVKTGRASLLAAYEATFLHHSFTGRSGAMYAYEGLGSIYWHMVAKLMLALMELRQRAVVECSSEDVVRGLDEAYLAVRRGIGYQKSPEDWGAFPFDPYSHTPRHAKAQQPGMTGQVKEEILTRLGEFGLLVSSGSIRALPTGFLAHEYLSEPRIFTYLDAEFRKVELPVATGEAVCTLCQVPFIRRTGTGPIRMKVSLNSGNELHFGDTLDRETSQAILGRDGTVRAVFVEGS